MRGSSISDSSEAEAPGEKSLWLQRAILGAVCLLVIGVYAYTAHSGVLESSSPNAAGTYYNLLVQGFQAGQLSLKQEVPPGLAQLADPYNPSASAIYRYAIPRLHDMTYFNGRLYLYFGITPVLILFWPFVALSGHYLFHRQAVVIFCSIGFLTSVWLLVGIWRRYFAEVSIAVVAGCVLALGLATGVPVMLSRCEVYEVAVSCGYMLTMLALVAIWHAFQGPERRCQWLALASLAYGLALGARPSLLFGAVILLVPVVRAWRERKQIGSLLIAASCPIILIGLGLMLYNFLRFDTPFEFGIHYQLAAVRDATVHFFGLRYLWFNLRVYFLEPARWSAHFPFVHEIIVPPMPSDYRQVEAVFGILPNVPVALLSLVVPFSWRGRSAQERRILCGFLTAVGLFFGICALTTCLLNGAMVRYEVEFLPALLLLAVVGTLGLDRALADRRAWRRMARVGCGLMLGFSVAFNLFASLEHYAGTEDGLGVAFGQAGRVQEAIEHFNQALRIDPGFADAHDNLGSALWLSGRTEEAIAQFEQVARLKPHDAEVLFNLGVALTQLGRTQEAMAHWEQALRINPDHPEAHYNLGVALVRMGRVQEAMAHWEQVVRINPDHAQAHLNLAVALEQTGDIQGAVEHYEQALRIKPDYAEARNGLARARSVHRTPPVD